MLLEPAEARQRHKIKRQAGAEHERPTAGERLGGVTHGRRSGRADRTGLTPSYWAWAEERPRGPDRLHPMSSAGGWQGCCAGGAYQGISKINFRVHRSAALESPRPRPTLNTQGLRSMSNAAERVW